MALTGPTGTFSAAPALTPLEVATGTPWGLSPGSVPLRVTRRALSPVEALEQVLVTALERPPCLVSFSGGRDSSGLLALAARVSRQRGLDLPIPATLVFPADAAANEDEWQQVVLKELDLPDWARVEVAAGELDAVGPVAAKALARHGLLWPFNTHFHAPIMELASGGSVVTGFGGDELARASAACRAERLLTRQQRAGKWGTAAGIGLAVAPRPVREAVFRGRFVDRTPWLTPAGKRLAREADTRDDAAVPFGFDRKLCAWVWRSRYFRVCQSSFQALGDACDVEVFHPWSPRWSSRRWRLREASPGSGGAPTSCACCLVACSPRLH